jgi:hypothetical protein
MSRIQDVTTAALLDHVEARLRRMVGTGQPIPHRVYAADAEGRVTAIEVPEAVDDADRGAIEALVDMHLRAVGAVLTVRQVPRRAARSRVELRAGPAGDVPSSTRIWDDPASAGDEIRVTRPAPMS